LGPGPSCIKLACFTALILKPVRDGVIFWDGQTVRASWLWLIDIDIYDRINGKYCHGLVYSWLDEWLDGWMYIEINKEFEFHFFCSWVAKHVYITLGPYQKKIENRTLCGSQ